MMFYCEAQYAATFTSQQNIINFEVKLSAIPSPLIMGKNDKNVTVDIHPPSHPPCFVVHSVLLVKAPPSRVDKS